MTEKKYIASFSGGKDSTAMVLRLIEEGRPLDEIVFFDTGWEFPQMYDHIVKFEAFVGQKVTMIKPKHSFEHWMFEHPVIARKGPMKGKVHRVGNGWPNHNWRWCTGLKRDTMKSYCKKAIQYIGFAYDEKERASRNSFKRGTQQIYPLIEYGMNEADCLTYCRTRGFDWGGLYDHFTRVSCFCCPLKKLSDLRKLRKHYPDLWAQMLNWDAKLGTRNRGFKGYDKVADLERRFASEDRQLSFHYGALVNIQKDSKYFGSCGIIIKKEKKGDEMKEKLDKPIDEIEVDDEMVVAAATNINEVLSPNPLLDLEKPGEELQCDIEELFENILEEDPLSEDTWNILKALGWKSETEEQKSATNEKEEQSMAKKPTIERNQKENDTGGEFARAAADICKALTVNPPLDPAMGEEALSKEIAAMIPDIKEGDDLAVTTWVTLKKLGWKPEAKKSAAPVASKSASKAKVAAPSAKKERVAKAPVEKKAREYREKSIVQALRAVGKGNSITLPKLAKESDALYVAGNADKKPNEKQAVGVLKGVTLKILQEIGAIKVDGETITIIKSL